MDYPAAGVAHNKTCSTSTTIFVYADTREYKKTFKKADKAARKLAKKKPTRPVDFQKYLKLLFDGRKK